MKNKIRAIFIGTPDFGIPSLEALMSDDFFEVAAVITQPDRPVGRNRVNTPPPIKTAGLKFKLPILQPEKIKDIAGEIKKLSPDLIVVIAYAQIIPEEILAIPKYGCINVHASLLPKYRGASVIQAAILSGDKETGVTIMKMDKNLDTGPIIFQKNITIERGETASSLFEKLSRLGAEILAPTLKKYVAGKLKPQAQNDKLSSYVKTLKKEDGQIDLNKPAEELERFIRAMNPWPGAYARVKEKGQTVKITKVAPTVYDLNDLPVGKVFYYKNKLALQCGRDALVIERLQLEGKKEMTADEFLRGHGDFLGAILT